MHRGQGRKRHREKMAIYKLRIGLEQMFLSQSWEGTNPANTLISEMQEGRVMLKALLH